MKNKKRRTDGKVRALASRTVHSLNTLPPNAVKEGQLIYDPSTGKWYYRDPSGNLVELVGSIGGVIDGGTY